MTLDLNLMVSIAVYRLAGNGVRSTAQLAGVSKSTVQKYTRILGEGCALLLDAKFTNLTATRIQCDELHSFVHTRDRHLQPDADPTHGDVWGYFAIDEVSRAVISYRLGKREQSTTHAFVEDLSRRVLGKPSITTDGYKGYLSGLRKYFENGVDHAQYVKAYVSARNARGKLAAQRFVSARKLPMLGRPNLREASTSHIERFNNTLREHVPGFRRKSIHHAKNIDYLQADLVLFLAFYNFVRVHSAHGSTPAHMLGVTDGPWAMDELVHAALAAYRGTSAGAAHVSKAETKPAAQDLIVAPEPFTDASLQLSEKQQAILLALYDIGPTRKIAIIARRAFPDGDETKRWGAVRNILPTLLKRGVVEYTRDGAYAASTLALDMMTNAQYKSH